MGKPNKYRRDSKPSARSGAQPPKVSTVASANIVMGRNCLREVLRHKPEIIKKLLCGLSPEVMEQSAADLGALARQRGIGIEWVSGDDLTQFVGSSSHQGFAAIIKERVYTELRSFLDQRAKAEKSAVLCLDSISDPQNFGAALRAAECFGFDAVMWSRNRGVGITPVVAKASVGASELVTTVPVANLVDSLRKLKEEEYWIVAADANPEAQVITAFEFPRRFALVVGAEGEGISRLALEQADYRVYIPLFGHLKSLNVSQAIAVFMAAFRAQG